MPHPAAEVPISQLRRLDGAAGLLQTSPATTGAPVAAATTSEVTNALMGAPTCSDGDSPACCGGAKLMMPLFEANVSIGLGLQDLMGVLSFLAACVL